MQKGSTVILAITIIALLFMQGVSTGIAASQKEQCEAGVREEFDGYKAANAADTKKDGNMVTHGFGCSECALQYQTCEDAVDKAVTDCARASGYNPANTCNADREGSYYACYDAQTDCCLAGELIKRCGSLSDTDPDTASDAGTTQQECLSDGYYWMNGECVGETQANQICFGKYGIRGYPSSQTECDECPKGQVYIGTECITDQKCTGLANMVYDANIDYCVCKEGFAPTASGDCQQTERKYVGIAVPSRYAVTIKGGQTQTLNIPLPASLATKGYGKLTLKPVIQSKDDGIKSITFSPASVMLSYGGSTQTITVTISADDVDEFRQYGATIRWNGYDDKQLYAGDTDLKVNIVQPDTPFMPEPDTETATKFEELRQRQLPDMITSWKFGEDQTRTLYAKLDQLDPESSEDLKIMASFVAFVDAFNSLTNPVGTILEETTPLPDSGFGPPLVTRSNPFSTLDAKLFAKTLIGVADHSVKLKEAHEKVQEMLKTGGD